MVLNPHYTSYTVYNHLESFFKFLCQGSIPDRLHHSRLGCGEQALVFSKAPQVIPIHSGLTITGLDHRGDQSQERFVRFVCNAVGSLMQQHPFSTLTRQTRTRPRKSSAPGARPLAAGWPGTMTYNLDLSSRLKEVPVFTTLPFPTSTSHLSMNLDSVHYVTLPYEIF